MPRIEQLSIYLIKNGITAWTDAIRDTAAFNEVTLPATSPEGAALITRSTQPHGPTWLRFFPATTRDEMQELLAASSGAVYLLPVRNRWFAVCFGTGWHLLKTDSYVRGFGLKAALSVVKPATLKNVDVSTYENFAKHRRVSTSKGTTIDSFDIEGQLELLRGVIGDCGFPGIGQQIGGKDACILWTRVSFDRLHKLCNVLLNLYESPRVAKRYPIVNNVTEVRDPSEALRLDGLLDTQIASNQNHDVSIAPPEVVDWQNTHSFELEHESAPPASLSISFDEVRTMLNPASPTSANMRNIRLITKTPTGTNGLQAWTLYDCLVTEIDDPINPSVKCILMAGEWYVVASTLVSKVNQELGTIPPHALALPDALPIETEGDYNSRFAGTDPTNLTLLDKKNISYGGGRSRIEVCDVLSSASCLYHIKDYSGSATLSHLFSQGCVSARLLLDEEFRKELLNNHPTLPQNVIKLKSITPGKIEVTYAIICEPGRALPAGLPFFSKVRLLEASRELKRMGFKKVTLAKITRQ